MGFTTSPSGKLAAGNTITATFNSNVTVPATPTVTLGTGFTGCTATASATGGVVTITLAGASCAVNNSTAASLTIAGITNPGAQTLTNTTFKVATAEDTSAGQSGLERGDRGGHGTERRLLLARVDGRPRLLHLERGLHHLAERQAGRGQHHHGHVQLKRHRAGHSNGDLGDRVHRLHGHGQCDGRRGDHHLRPLARPV